MVFTKTTAQQSGGSGQLVEYIEQEKVEEKDKVRAELRDSIGRELSEEEIEEFVENSKGDNFSRQIVFSSAPENDLSEQEMREKTERVMNDYIDGKPSAHYLYGVHEDTDQIHSHAAVRGDRRDLFMDTDDLKDMKVEAEREFRGPEQARELANDLGIELSEEREQRLGLDHEESKDLRETPGQDREVIEADASLDLDADLDLGGVEQEQQQQEPEQDQGMGLDP